MASRAQKKANRANARKSTGPRTVSGRAAAAQNAVRHGLAGSFAVLAYEDQNEFESLLASYREDYAPTSTAERFLVQQMAKAHWTLARAERIADCVFNHLSGIPQPDSPDLQLAISIIEKSQNPILTVERYRAAAERTYHRSKRELELSRQRQQRETRLRERPAPAAQVPYHQQVMERNRPQLNEANPSVPLPNAFRSIAREALELARRNETNNERNRDPLPTAA
jgi:hypothetical protein